MRHIRQAIVRPNIRQITEYSTIAEYYVKCRILEIRAEYLRFVPNSISAESISGGTLPPAPSSEVRQSHARARPLTIT